jgi:hypothetical protein
MITTKTTKLPIGAKIISAKGYRKNGKATSIVKYELKGKQHIMCFPGKGGEA